MDPNTTLWSAFATLSPAIIPISISATPACFHSHVTLLNPAHTPVFHQSLRPRASLSFFSFHRHWTLTHASSQSHTHTQQHPSALVHHWLWLAVS